MGSSLLSSRMSDKLVLEVAELILPRYGFTVVPETYQDHDATYLDLAAPGIRGSKVVKVRHDNWLDFTIPDPFPGAGVNNAAVATLVSVLREIWRIQSDKVLDLDLEYKTSAKKIKMTLFPDGDLVEVLVDYGSNRSGTIVVTSKELFGVFDLMTHGGKIEFSPSRSVSVRHAENDPFIVVTGPIAPKVRQTAEAEKPQIVFLFLPFAIVDGDEVRILNEVAIPAKEFFAVLRALRGLIEYRKERLAKS